MQRPSDYDDNSPLSNEDIDNLYNIIENVSYKPGENFRAALFKAYDAASEAGEFGEDVGEKYFHFMLLLLEEYKDGQTPYARFKEVLASMGITIDKSDDAITENFETYSAKMVGFFGGANSGTRHSANNRHSAMTRSDPDEISETHSDHCNVQDARQSDLPTPHKRSTSFETYDRLDLREDPSLRKSGQSATSATRPQPRSISASGPHVSRMIRDVGANVWRLNAHVENVEEQSSPPSESPETTRTLETRTGGSSGLLPLDLHEHSEEELEEWADAYRNNKILITARASLWKWRNAAADVRREYSRQSKRSEMFQRDILLRWALRHWRKTSAERIESRVQVEARETESFFTRLEESMVNAFDTFVLAKAFTHWAQSTQDEIQRTAVARRHIFRTRYFNAWKDITAVNEIKVRRFEIRKFFGIWMLRYREHSLQRIRDERMALATYEFNLVKNAWTLWYFHLCENRAPYWKSRERREHVFKIWLYKTREQLETNRIATDRQLRKSYQSALKKWTSRLHQIHHYSHTAADLRMQRQISSIFTTWLTQAQLSPIGKLFAKIQTRKMASNILNHWNYQASLSSKAKAWENSVLVRRTFNEWKYALRARIVEQDRDDRIAWNALSQWGLATKLSQFQSKKREFIKSNALTVWVEKYRARKAMLADPIDQFASRQRLRLLHQKFTLWSSTTHSRRHTSAFADSVRINNLLAWSFGKLRDRHSQLQFLDRQANIAQEYMAGRHSIQLWQFVTRDHQRKRRRDAYAMIRRKVKMRLARLCLNCLTERAGQISTMHRMAEEKVEDKLVVILQSNLQDWKSKIDKFRADDQQALRLYQRNLAFKAFQRLHSRLSTLQDMGRTASAVSFGSAGVFAFDCLKTLDRKLFRIRGQNEWASRLRQKHTENHARGMFHYWRERATTSRQVQTAPGRPPNPPLGNRGDDEDRLPGDGTIRRRVHEWGASAFKNEPLVLNLDLVPNLDSVNPTHPGAAISSPLPGYLRTPSKRSTARAFGREHARPTDAHHLLGTPVHQFHGPLPIRLPLETPRPPASAPATSLSSQVGAQGLDSKITPFAQKLKAKGVSTRTSTGFLLGGGQTPSGHPGGHGRQVRFGDEKVIGFDDIPEEQEQRNDRDENNSG